MDPWSRVILNRLLDKYETSAAFLRGERTTRRVQVPMTDAVVPRYRSGGMDPDERKTLHDTLERLERLGWVELDWDRFERGNLLTRVILQWDGIDLVYDGLGRKRKEDVLQSVREELAAYRTRLTPHWMQRWLDDVEAAMDAKKAIPESLLPAQPEKRQLLLESLAGLVDKGDEVMAMRLFSKRYLKSSKAFEQGIRSRFESLLRQYWLPTEASAEFRTIEDEASVLLNEVGIEVAHEDVAFCGPLVLMQNGRRLDCCAVSTGVAVDAESLGRMDVVEWGAVRRVLSIENKANYRYYVRTDRKPDDLVIYLGGFPSPAKRRFLKKLWDVVRHGCLGDSGGHAEVVFQHWGDLDYGGILIGQLLRDTVWPDMTPWRMEPKWLDTLADFVEPFTDSYRKKLETLLQQPRYALWYDLIRKLLDVGGTLEQEAFLV
ncbi:Wadjet anti-phage system protein JetD domain-containing protein [Alicyclobacillus contaminans]|uniref:Wadjet anti-phage system protein JetD domain-containing protein n=1 Tax=Alicyclobacillus contaminans TaxID=392016 RepID=UPI000405F92B|nr:Wadjet anti-phage system protein JetD domain-containing protein [Alicyclobacillus contaminans]